jgi:hypothetical protein
MIMIFYERYPYLLPFHFKWEAGDDNDFKMEGVLIIFIREVVYCNTQLFH